ncbi:hypothetical protein [Nostoc sp.]|uniref:hypothetical protein n=1 Tax=Nostoc sp. TaxID=1180 RepID=UPI002FF980D5
MKPRSAVVAGYLITLSIIETWVQWELAGFTSSMNLDVETRHITSLHKIPNWYDAVLYGYSEPQI